MEQLQPSGRPLQLYVNGPLRLHAHDSYTFSKVIVAEPELPAVSDIVGGDAVSVNVGGGGGAYAGERKRAPIIVSTRIESTASAINLNLLAVNLTSTRRCKAC